MNLLLLSPGRRCEIAKYFKEELNRCGGRLFALDMNKDAPALHFADKYFVINKDFNNLKEYINKIIKICKGKTRYSRKEHERVFKARVRSRHIKS